MSERTVVLGLAGDIHAGSTLGLCPPTGVELDDGGTYMPSAHQAWLWHHWIAAWLHVQQVLERERRVADDDVDFGLVCNGDSTDGNHHNTVQIISPAEGAHIKCAAECWREPLKLSPKWTWIIRGTEAHVGKSGGLEEGMSVAMDREGAPIVRAPGTEKRERGPWSWWELQAEFNGRLVHFTHHGRMGQRAHTRASYAKLYAFDIWAERKLRDERAPDVAVRSHCHLYDDTGPAHPTRPVTRLIALPAFQLKTAYGYRIAAESLSDVGIGVLIIRGNGKIEVDSYVVSPSRGEIWKPI